MYGRFNCHKLILILEWSCCILILRKLDSIFLIGQSLRLCFCHGHSMVNVNGLLHLIVIIIIIILELPQSMEQFFQVHFNNMFVFVNVLMLHYHSIFIIWFQFIFWNILLTSVEFSKQLWILVLKINILNFLTSNPCIHFYITIGLVGELLLHAQFLINAHLLPWIRCRQSSIKWCLGIVAHFILNNYKSIIWLFDT